MKIGFVNGCFDVLHIGHLRMFNECKNNVDRLIVAIDTDERVKLLKGEQRPYNNLENRKEMLLNLSVVDIVLSFENEEELEIIVKCLKPDLMMVGEEYKNKKVIGSKYAKEIKFFRRLNEYSTTKILESAINRR